MFLNNNPQKLTLAQKIQKQRDKMKLKANLNQSDIIGSKRSKSTMRRPSIEIELESDIDKQTEFTSKEVSNLKINTIDSSSIRTKQPNKSINSSIEQPKNFKLVKIKGKGGDPRSKAVKKIIIQNQKPTNFALSSTLEQENDNAQIVADSSTKYQRPSYKTPQRNNAKYLDVFNVQNPITTNPISFPNINETTPNPPVIPLQQETDPEPPLVQSLNQVLSTQNAIEAAFTSNSNPNNYLDLDNPDKYRDKITGFTGYFKPKSIGKIKFHSNIQEQLDRIKRDRENLKNKRIDNTKEAKIQKYIEKTEEIKRKAKQRKEDKEKEEQEIQEIDNEVRDQIGFEMMQTNYELN